VSGEFARCGAAWPSSREPSADVFTKNTASCCPDRRMPVHSQHLGGPPRAPHPATGMPALIRHEIRRHPQTHSRWAITARGTSRPLHSSEHTSPNEKPPVCGRYSPHRIASRGPADCGHASPPADCSASALDRFRTDYFMAAHGTFNGLQKMMLRWEEFHAVNAAHVVQLGLIQAADVI